MHLTILCVHTQIDTHNTSLCLPALCVLASTWSTFCRCWILLVFPSMLSSRGQTYLLLFVLSVLCRGGNTHTHEG